MEYQSTHQDVTHDQRLQMSHLTVIRIFNCYCNKHFLNFRDFIGPIFGGWMADDGGFAWTLTYTGLACIVVVSI